MKDWKAMVRRGAMLALLLTMICSMALAALSYPFTSVTTDSVRLRRSPSSSAVVLKTLRAPPWRCWPPAGSTSR